MIVPYIGVLDHHDGVGAARNHAAGRDRHGLTWPHVNLRKHAGIDCAGQQLHAARRQLAGAKRIGGVNREPIEVRAVERRHIDAGDDIRGEHAPQGIGQRNLLDAERLERKRRAKPRLGLVPIDHI